MLVRYGVLIVCFFLILSCTDSSDKLIGSWTQPIPGQEESRQGFTLQPKGQASSINMSTLLYKEWQVKNDSLVLDGESIGNGQNIAFTETFFIERLTPDTLILRREQLYLVYTRDE